MSGVSLTEIEGDHLTNTGFIDKLCNRSPRGSKGMSYFIGNVLQRTIRLHQRGLLFPIIVIEVGVYLLNITNDMKLLFHVDGNKPCGKALFLQYISGKRRKIIAITCF